MKEKTIIFLIGLLLGAIISTSSIYIYTIANKGNNNEMNLQMPNNRQDNIMENNGNKPPEIPNNNQENNEFTN